MSWNGFGSRALRRALLAPVAVLIVLPAGAEAAELSISSAKKQVTFGNGTAIKGRLSQEPTGNGGKRVTLFARPYPYRSSRRLRSKLTAEDGSYRFRIRPGWNTRYFTRVRETTGGRTASRRHLVIVNARTRTRLRQPRPRIVKARFTFEYGRGLKTRFHRRVIRWYFFKRGQSFARLVRKTRTRRVRRGKVFGKARFRIPKGRFRFSVFWCFDVRPGTDVGLASPDRDPCPRGKRIRVPTAGSKMAATRSR